MLLTLNKCLSAGTNGTNGTDLGTTLTTQGDLVYRDGSGLQRLGAGTAGQVLQTGGAGANPSWGTVSSDFVKLAGIDLSNSTATQYDFTQFMDDSVYRSYKIQIIQKFNDSSSNVRMRFLNNTTPYSGATDYKFAGYNSYRRTDNSDNTLGTSNDGDGRDYAQLMGWACNNSYLQYYDVDIIGLPTGTSSQVGYKADAWGRDSSGAAGDYIFKDSYGGFLDNTDTVDGVRFYSSSGSQLDDTQFTIWGLKK
jgi:hypothetical protein